MEDFLRKFTNVLPILCTRFRCEKVAGCMDDRPKIDAQVLVCVKEALESEGLLAMTLFLYTLTAEIGQQPSWCEGCHCHDYLLREGVGSKRQKLLNHKKLSKDCVWRWRTACEFATCRVGAILNDIREAENPHVKLILASASEQSRAAFVAMGANLKANCCQLLSGKLRYWRCLPYSCIGIFGQAVGVCSLDKSVGLCRQAFREVGDAIRKDGGATLHRVARRLLVSRENQLREQVEQFAKGGSPLQKFPAVFLELRKYALAPVVTRRTEGVHALVCRYGRKAKRFHPRLANASLRKPFRLRCLDDHQLFQWAVEAYNKRNLLRRLLHFVAAPSKRNSLAVMTTKRLEGKLFLCDAEHQFRTLSLAPPSSAAWKKIAKDSASGYIPVRLTLPAILDHVREAFRALSGALFSVPAGCFPDEPAAPPQPCDAATLVDALERASHYEPGDTFEGEALFKVINPHPSAKHVGKAQREDRSTTFASVGRCKATRTHGEVEVHCIDGCVPFDLRCFADPVNLCQLKMWAPQQQVAPLQLAPEALQCVASRLSTPTQDVAEDLA